MGKRRIVLKAIFCVDDSIDSTLILEEAQRHLQDFGEGKFWDHSKQKPTVQLQRVKIHKDPNLA